MVIMKAETAVMIEHIQPHYYYQILNLKGLAHVELGQFKQAIEILKETVYYDLQLVEKLIDHGVGLTECRDFLLRALDKHKSFKMRGEDVNSSISKIERLIVQLDKGNEEGP